MGLILARQWTLTICKASRLFTVIGQNALNAKAKNYLASLNWSLAPATAAIAA